MSEDSWLAATMSSQEADVQLFSLLASKKPSGMFLQYKPQLDARQFISEVDQMPPAQSPTAVRRLEEERMQSKSNPGSRGEERFIDFLKKKTMEEFSLTTINPFAPRPPKEDLQKQLPGNRGAGGPAPPENKPFYANQAPAEQKPAEPKHEGFMTARHLLERNMKNKGHFTQAYEPPRQPGLQGTKEEGR